MSDITEEYLEHTLRAIRSCPIETGRELLRTFAADARAGGMIDFVKALENKNPLPKSLAELKQSMEERGF